MKQRTEIALTVLVLLLIGITLTPEVWGFDETVGSHYSTTWTSTIRTPSGVGSSFNPALDYSANLSGFKPEKCAPYKVCLLQAFGGRESDNVRGFLNAVALDAAAMREHYKTKAQLSPGAFWQVGNEINNAKLAASIHDYLGDGNAGVMHDTTIIPVYVEQWLAPLVSGLKSGGATVVLGSVANAANSNAIDFSNALLDYMVTGAYAPDLAGKKVSEIVDVFSIHYSMSAQNWLDPISIGVTRGLPVWHTEEVGGGPAGKGLGMVAALTSVGRFYAGNPGGKIFLWGAGVGDNNVDTWMPMIAGHLVGAVIPDVLDVAGYGLEVRTFNASSGKIAFILGDGKLNAINEPGTLYVFAQTGVTILAVDHGVALDVTISQTSVGYFVAGR